VRFHEVVLHFEALLNNDDDGDELRIIFVTHSMFLSSSNGIPFEGI
jgi:hypothetical protein